MADPTTVDGRPIEGGSAKPVAVMNPLSVTLTGTIPGTVEIANDSGNPVPVSGTVEVANDAGNPIPVSAADGVLVTLGTTTDAAIVTSTAGTVIGFLRGLISLIVAKITVIIAGAGGTPVQLDDTDKLAVSLYGDLGAPGDTGVRLTAAVDGRSELNGLFAVACSYLWNGLTFDRARANHEVAALASAARTASVNSADLVNYNARGVIVVIDVTALTATGQLTVTLQGKDTLSGQYYTLIVSAAILATGTTVLRVYPGSTTVANLVADSAVPRIWRVSIAALNGVSITYSAGVNYVS